METTTKHMSVSMYNVLIHYFILYNYVSFKASGPYICQLCTCTHVFYIRFNMTFIFLAVYTSVKFHKKIDLILY